MSIRRSAVMGPVLWAGLCAFAFTISTIRAEHTATGTALKYKPAMHRQKRTWVWKSFYLEEEKPNPPHHIGKLTSTMADDQTKFVIEGEGANSVFHVSSQGDIYATEKLDREIKSTYYLTAHLLNIATNKSVEPAEQFNIQITDLNDNNPEFSQSFNGSIPERSEPGTNVLTVTATDADDPTTANAQLEYKLLNELDVFEIDRNGRITTKIDFLDHEKQSVYLVMVQAKDMPGMQTGGSATTTVTITVSDINDNMATFKKQIFSFDVAEDKRENSVIGTMEVEDKDEEQNKDPTFTIVADSSRDSGLTNVFKMERNLEKNGILILKQGLDFENRKRYDFDVHVHEDNVRNPTDNQGFNMITKAKVIVNVLDVDEPPIFSKKAYVFSLREDSKINVKVGSISARDPDAASHKIRYSIDDQKCPIRIHPETGDMYLNKKLDRELTPIHNFRVTAEESSSKALKSYMPVSLEVHDVNDNAPELTNSQDLFVCENDEAGTIIRTIGATDKDEHQPRFNFSLAKHSPDFLIIDNGNNTANITVKQGGFDEEERREYLLEIVLKDGGLPPLSSTTTVTVHVCTCGTDRKDYYCKPAYVQTGISPSALITILLCILIILVIVILVVMRKRCQKDAFVSLGKSFGEIHEQLVSYDEEGGGEMDTNGYDVSILTSARNEGSLRMVPCLYTVASRPPVDRGNMATMIEVRKDEADHDRDGIPYDTLHIYGYEGSESLASSLSSLDSSSSSGSNLDYDFLTDWGPHFKTLAELYGVNSSDKNFC